MLKSIFPFGRPEAAGASSDFFDFLFPLSAANGELNVVSANRQISEIVTGVFIGIGFVCIENQRLGSMPQANV